MVENPCVAFMFIFTAFVSLQSLQSVLHSSGIGLVSLSCIYTSTVISCLFAPWLISKITTKWTIVAAFAVITAYFGANFFSSHFVLIPFGILMGLMAGPLWSAQATYITTLSITYAKHMQMDECDSMINKFMGLFYGCYRSSQIWGNLISTVVLHSNVSYGNLFDNTTYTRHCGASQCDIHSNELSNFDIVVPDSTKYMLLTIFLACGIMAIVIICVLLDNTEIVKTDFESELNLTNSDTLISTLNMLKDPKCLLLIPLVLFVGLEQGFVFGDFTKSYVNCTLGVNGIGPLLVCFGTVSSISSLVIGFISKHIKRFAFIIAAAIFNIGLLIVLWLWRPLPIDIPNFYVIAGCLGLCDAIWQTQTYTLFGVLFAHKQEAAFSSYRMFHATGCAVAFGYSYFLCVETKVYIMAAVLAIALSLYSIIEIKLQIYNRQLKEIVAL
ncbi:hypothetical protein LOTGIDRAFT_236145 [Lottia gigantea]|uniref:Major facilitator superfamily (MFS) profile domain-containing protein n=1 Tax=Lottia gigantea TaxID=225164 RepID=V3ZQ39_LOTGI|nr:hypothetical protein LOTGIDRAFT_236145 [Lottia gigantea]ESO84620.1 hypothetical protein LOTGIDRAFT_236145 [Lottia gigantea]